MTNEFIIERAERRQALLRLALAGPSGSGKTWSSLLLAKGLAGSLREAGVMPGPVDGKIGFICSERGSARLYAHIVPFDMIELKPPYSPDRYIRALRALENAGCKIVIIDQISHAWAGKGGLLEQLDRSSNTFNAFADITPVQNQFVEDLLASSAHLIVTMRAKTEWVQEEYVDRNGKTKTRPKRVGMAPIQRAGIEYEFTTLVNLDTENNMGEVLKDRTNVLGVNNKVKFGEHHGEQFVQWLLAGAPIESQEEEPPAEERAQAVVDACCRMMESAKTNPDRGRIYHQHKDSLIKFMDEMPEPSVRAFIQAIGERYRELAQARPALAISGPAGDFLAPREMEQIEQLLRQAAIPIHEVLAEFDVSRLTLIPAEKYDSVVGWVINMAGLNGLAIERPARPLPPAEPAKISAQQVLEEKHARQGGVSLFAEGTKS